MTQIKYAKASLAKTTNKERRRVNLDFIIEGSSKINKVVFKLTDRLREYPLTIPEQELIDWPNHYQIMNWARELRADSQICWIGKGAMKQTFIQGGKPVNVRFQQTGALLVKEDLNYKLLAMIDNWEINILLEPSAIENYPFIGEFKGFDITAVKSVRGNWQ